jgi:hypothetical protein
MKLDAVCCEPGLIDAPMEIMVTMEPIYIITTAAATAPAVIAASEIALVALFVPEDCDILCPPSDFLIW